MKKTIFLIIFLFGYTVSNGQKPEKAKLSGSGPHELYLSFHTDLDFNANGNFMQQAIAYIPEIKSIADEYHFSLSKGIQLSDEKLDEMESAIKNNAGDANTIKILRNTFKVLVNKPDDAVLLALAQKLESLPSVAYCELIPLKPPLPPGDILPVTLDYLQRQSYLDENPGVDMAYAWNLDLAGSGIKIRDVEYGFNKNHEEFNELPGAFLAPGMTVSSDATTRYTEHGTAIFGIVYADKGAYGITGMANAANEMVLFPEWQESGYDRVNAVTEAIANSVAGDVILYEIQIADQGNHYVPAEYSLTIWNLTKAATEAGIVIVAAAGNGNADLDSETYSDYRGRGNSGAIIVGAGTSDVSHHKTNFSSYGERVDVQGWGIDVFSAGYGYYEAVGGDFNQNYTNSFSGTSPAAAIVASCVTVLQSHYHSLNGNYLTSVEMRDLLISTGISQGSGGHIGPLPNMQAAIEAINLLAAKSEQNKGFVVFPNPTADKLTILGNLSENANLEVCNSLGQKLYQAKIPIGQTVDLSAFPSGVYFLKINSNELVSVKRIIKK